MNDFEFKKLIASEMLRYNILASNVIYLSTAHHEKLLERYFQKLDKILSKYKKKLT